jgi:hypothetical protein
MSSSKGDRFVKEEEFGISPWLHEFSSSVLKTQRADKPTLGTPPLRDEVPLVIVQAPTIAHKKPMMGCALN